MTQLQELNLGENQIGDEGAAALAPALGKMTQLQELNLDGNEVPSLVLAPALQLF
jgi:hypothetical protein